MQDSLRQRASSGPPCEAERGPRLPPFLLAAGVACVLATAVAQREAIVRTVPAGARIYAMLGLPVNLRGLAFRDVKGILLDEGQQRVLAIAGEISNLRGSTWPVPDLRIAVRGSDGREMYTWTTAAPKPDLEAGETVAFRARLATPPEGAREIVVRFAEARETGRR
jgi:hypothetical protein